MLYSTKFLLCKFNVTKCVCHEGYSNKNCAVDIDECASIPCQNNGICLERSNISLYSASNRPSDNRIPSVFFGEFSYENASGYECLCPAGIIGKACEIDIDECASQPCLHGTCHDEVCFGIFHLFFVLFIKMTYIIHTINVLLNSF